MKKKEETEEFNEETEESEEFDEGTEEPTEEESVEEETEEREERTARPERKMFKIKCSECGRDAEVPFQPSDGRPVYCRDCFMKRRRPRRSFGYRRF